MFRKTTTPLHTSAKLNGDTPQNANDTTADANNVDDDNRKQPKHRPQQQSTSPFVYFALLVIAIISYVTLPRPLQPHHGQEPSIQHVFYYGWLTAVSTGFGAIPLAFAPNLASYWVGISNAIAAGMMIAASYSLLYEGCTFDDPHDSVTIPVTVRTVFGAIVGLVFINVTEKLLSGHEELSVAGLAGADAKRALLIFFVMTLHSFSEGVGIGVSFGGVHGSELGVFISASLAVHNIPEGLAMAVTLIPRGTSLLTAVVFAILTSIPQPLMAVPAYVFVHHFIPFLPAGLGFAGGAMAWVALFELLMEAIEDSGLVTTATVSTISLLCMHCLNEMIDAGARA